MPAVLVSSFKYSVGTAESKIVTSPVSWLLALLVTVPLIWVKVPP